jgi:hypothetical protein
MNQPLQNEKRAFFFFLRTAQSCLLALPFFIASFAVCGTPPLSPFDYVFTSLTHHAEADIRHAGTLQVILRAYAYGCLCSTFWSLLRWSTF